LLGEPEREPSQPKGEIGDIEAEIFLEVELRHDLLVMVDRTSNEMREKRDEKRIVEWLVLARLATVGVDQKRDLRECEKRDADRQIDIRLRQGDAGHRVEGLDQKPGIFEVPEQQQIAADTDCQKDAILASQQHPTDEEIEGNRREDQRQEPIGVVEAVKYERGGNQPHHGEHLLAEPSQQKKDRQDDRQKYEYELSGVE